MLPVEASSLGLPHARQAACVERSGSRSRAQQSYCERSFYLCSHSAQQLSPSAMMGKIRNHWSIENGSHYPRDRYFDEDRCMIRNHRAARILAACRQFVISLKSRLGYRYTPHLCDHFAQNIHKAIQIII